MARHYVTTRDSDDTARSAVRSAASALLSSIHRGAGALAGLPLRASCDRHCAARDGPKQAGVGISALYRRYPSKEELLRRLSAEGLERYIATAEDALSDDADPWAAFAGFMHRVVDADVHSLTLRLAGTFAPTEELYRRAEHAQQLNERLLEQTKAAGAIGPDLVVDDLTFLFEQLASVRVTDSERTRQLRQRYLALHLQALHSDSNGPLPGPPPSWEEVRERWQRQDKSPAAWMSRLVFGTPPVRRA